jgi:hypothetical protein
MLSQGSTLEKWPSSRYQFLFQWAYHQMENIGKFLGACPPYGVRSDELFQAPDLYEGSNMTGVYTFSVHIYLCRFSSAWTLFAE